jgi:hypothetical protein
MTRQCAWCKTILGTTSLDTVDGVTHGICPSCSLQLLQLVGQMPANVRVSELPQGEPHLGTVR